MAFWRFAGLSKKSGSAMPQPKHIVRRGPILPVYHGQDDEEDMPDDWPDKHEIAEDQARRVLTQQYHLHVGSRVFLIVKKRGNAAFVVQPATILTRMSDRQPVILTFGLYASILLSRESALRENSWSVEGIVLNGPRDTHKRRGECLVGDLAERLFGDRAALRVEWVDLGA